MFMALELEPGSHEIRLTYCTPYLKAGMLLSVLGLVIYVMLVFRKKSNPNSIASGKSGMNLSLITENEENSNIRATIL